MTEIVKAVAVGLREIGNHEQIFLQKLTLTQVKTPATCNIGGNSLMSKKHNLT